MPRKRNDDDVAVTIASVSPLRPDGWVSSMPDDLPLGTRLNSMFEVVRFIAKGGMGAVYEGLNISSGERIAIKVLLSQLLNDQRSWELFRREANVLTRVSHEAIVQYRVLAKEPVLGVPYIVTEYIDGPSLQALLVGKKASLNDVLLLLQRLAGGLSKAHGLGAVHRDLSPDNVLLASGDISQAKIIDFGIAKDLDPATETIIGSGFAGKLGYCAPEQLGDYEGEVGPWTDVYSLGLVIYSFAVGRAINMGVTLSQAVDKRRKGVDIEEIEPRLRPLLLAMLRPDPADRLRSMAAVLSEVAAIRLDEDQPEDAVAKEPVAIPASDVPRTVFHPSRPIELSAPALPAGAEPAVDERFAAVPSVEDPASPSAVRRRLPMGLLMAVGGATFIGAVATAVLLLTAHPKSDGHPRLQASFPPTGSSTMGLARALLDQDCSLLQIEQAGEGRSGSPVVIAGLAGNPGRIAAALSAELRKGAVDTLRLDDVGPAPPAMCPALDAVRPASAGLQGSPSAVVSAQREYTIARQTDGRDVARAVVTVAKPLFGDDLQTILIAPDGALSPLSGASETLADGRVRMTADVATPGVFGIISVGRSGHPGAAAVKTVEDLRSLAVAPSARVAAAWFTVTAAAPGSAAILTTPGAQPANPAHVKGSRHTNSNGGAGTSPAGPARKDDLKGLY